MEQFWNERIWVEAKTKHDVYCLGVFYSPERADRYFVNHVNLNIEKVYENTKNIIIVGDPNEDLLHPNMYNLRNLLLLNSMINIISEPIRQQAILDPIIISGTVNDACNLFTNKF